MPWSHFCSIDIYPQNRENETTKEKQQKRYWTNHNVYKVMHCRESGPVRLPFVLSATISARPKVGQLRICQNCPSSAQCTSVYICIRACTWWFGINRWCICTYINKRKCQNCPGRVCTGVYTYGRTYMSKLPQFLWETFLSPAPDLLDTPSPPHLTEAFDMENFLRGLILSVLWTKSILKIEALPVKSSLCC